MRLHQVTLPFVDYDESARFYRRLGLRQIVDSPPRYARFETPSGETLSIHRAEAAIEHEVVVYLEVEDVDGTFAMLRQRGLSFESEATDQPWLWREAYLRDPAGNRLCIFHAGEQRRFPPWRVDVEASGSDTLDPADEAAHD